MKKKVDAKTSMLLHSEAKVEFYNKYLERYLRILYLASTIAEINIFDVFCGTGIYDNGKKGSPIVAFEAVTEIRNKFGSEKKINLFVNDSETKKIESVRNYIDERNHHICDVNYSSRAADEMFEEISKRIKAQGRSVRNLIFIDPYGYKEIKKGTLESLLENQRTEIILFLPISQMQRFTKTAVGSDLKPYEPLKEFVYSFFPGNHPIKQQTVKALDYIEFVKDALKFGRYLSTSYYIERDESNFYALFFVTPHSYGFETILDIKWKLDGDSGGGFRQPEAQTSLFHEQNKELQKLSNFERLEEILRNALSSPKNNKEIREIVLANEFLPSHAVEVFKNWQKDNPNFHVTDAITDKPAKRGSFYISWDSCNPAKNPRPKVVYTLN